MKLSWDLLIYFILICVFLAGLNIKQREAWAKDLLSPAGEGVYVVKEIKETSVSATVSQEIQENLSPVEKEIKLVFGEYAPKAFLLLRGNSICGGENRGLDPLAVNVNKDGSRDRGIFQVSDKYHPLTDAQAFDYKQNIRYSWRMFKNDNYTFIRWTIGRCLGI